MNIEFKASEEKTNQAQRLQNLDTNKLVKHEFAREERAFRKTLDKIASKPKKKQKSLGMLVSSQLEPYLERMNRIKERSKRLHPNEQFQ